MPLVDFVKNLTQREKTKTKKRSDDNMYVTKTKEVKIPLENDMTKVVTKEIKRPTVLGKLGDVEDKKEVKRSVRYESNSSSNPKEEVEKKSNLDTVKEAIIRKKYGNLSDEQKKRYAVDIEKGIELGNTEMEARQKKKYKYVPTGKPGEVKMVED